MKSYKSNYNSRYDYLDATDDMNFKIYFRYYYLSDNKELEYKIKNTTFIKITIK